MQTHGVHSHGYASTPLKCKTCKGKGKLKKQFDGFKPTCPVCHGSGVT